MSHRQPLNLLPEAEQQLRLDRMRRLMADASLPAILVTDLANIYYLTGRVYTGYIYLPAEGKPIYFVRRPVELEGDDVVYIRKPEQMTESIGLNLPEAVGLELDLLPYNSAMRLSSALGGIATPNASPVLRAARAVKTAMEQDALRMSGVKQEHVYRLIPKLYREGMRD
ncbi:MAG: aminopeptidase P family N-terminal domain-containing protein, partial [Paramuribaculum sp.]|nr:aminopeptidase P family N-terminal domain-containing protein [Paramuribaculum sp.]